LSYLNILQKGLKNYCPSFGLKDHAPIPGFPLHSAEVHPEPDFNPEKYNPAFLIRHRRTSPRPLGVQCFSDTPACGRAVNLF